MRSSQIRASVLLTLFVAGVWSWHHWSVATPLVHQARDLKDQVRAESAKTGHLKQHIAHLVYQLEQNTARLAQEHDD